MNLDPYFSLKQIFVVSFTAQLKAKARHLESRVWSSCTGKLQSQPKRLIENLQLWSKILRILLLRFGLETMLYFPTDIFFGNLSCEEC